MRLRRVKQLLNNYGTTILTTMERAKPMEQLLNNNLTTIEHYEKDICKSVCSGTGC